MKFLSIKVEANLEHSTCAKKGLETCTNKNKQNLEGNISRVYLIFETLRKKYRL